jgi:hypothetical protein
MLEDTNEDFSSFVTQVLEYMYAVDAFRAQLTTKALQRQQKVNAKNVKSDAFDRPLFNVGDLVLVDWPDHEAPSKLSPRLRGPMIIVDIGEHRNYQLRDIATGSVYTVHLERLMPYKTYPYRTNLEVTATDRDEYVVEKILAHTGSPKTRKEMKFLIRWLGFSADDDSWLSWNDVRLLERLDDYIKDHPELKSLAQKSCKASLVKTNVALSRNFSLKLKTVRLLKMEAATIAQGNVVSLVKGEIVVQGPDAGIAKDVLIPIASRRIIVDHKGSVSDYLLVMKDDFSGFHLQYMQLWIG